MFAYLGVLSSLGTAVGSLATHLYARAGVAHAASALAPAVGSLGVSALLLAPFRASLDAAEARSLS